MPANPHTTRVVYAITARVFGKLTTWSTTDVVSFLPFLNAPSGEWTYINTVRFDCDTFWEKYQQHTDGTR